MHLIHLCVINSARIISFFSARTLWFHLVNLMIATSPGLKKKFKQTSKSTFKSASSADKNRINQREMKSTKESLALQIMVNQPKESIINQMQNSDKDHDHSNELEELEELQSLRRSKEEWTYGIWWFCVFVMVLIGLSIYLFIIGLVHIIAFILPLTLFCLLLFVWMCREDIRYSNKIYDKVNEINENWMNVDLGESETRAKFQVQDRYCCCNYKLFSNL